VWFEELVAGQSDVIGPLATWIGLDPAAFPEGALSSENRTTGYKSKGLQKLALVANDRMERVLRRRPDLKRKLRAFYYRLNGARLADDIPVAVRNELAERYQEPNARLTAQLERARIPLPSWLSEQRRPADRS
jgi:hypothetical protein